MHITMIEITWTRDKQRPIYREIRDPLVLFQGGRRCEDGEDTRSMKADLVDCFVFLHASYRCYDSGGDIDVPEEEVIIGIFALRNMM